MALQVNTYSSKEVVVIFGGFQMKGLADGDFCTVAHNAEHSTKVTGADGITSRSISADKSARATIRIQQTSLSNAVLQGFADNDLVLPFMVRDLNGTSRVSSAQAWIAVVPDASFGMEAGVREWGIDLAEATFNHGGNQ